MRRKKESERERQRHRKTENMTCDKQGEILKCKSLVETRDNSVPPPPPHCGDQGL